MDSTWKARPPRLGVVFQTRHSPVYSVTCGTWSRRKLLATPPVRRAFCEYVRRGVERLVHVGRYVVMPDHLHLFVDGGEKFDLGLWMRGLKRAIAKALTPSPMDGKIWQPGFFDHLLRSSERYQEKWQYVWSNPVRAGLVDDTDRWPYQGEIVRIHR